MELKNLLPKLPFKNPSEFMDFMITGGAPERKECECDEMTGFLCHLHDIELRGDNVANRY